MVLQGCEGDTEDSTLLYGGKQLAKGFYMAAAKDPTNANVVKANESGYYVQMWPKSLPRDVCLEIVRHSNSNNRGVQDTLPERIQKADW